LSFGDGQLVNNFPSAYCLIFPRKSFLMMLIIRCGAVFSLAMLLLLGVSCRHGATNGTNGTADSVVITGRLARLGSGWVVVTRRDASGAFLRDSVRAVSDSFSFRDRVPDTTVVLYELTVAGTPGAGLRLFLAPGHVRITGDRDSVGNVRVEGSVAEDEYRDYRRLMEPLCRQKDSLNQAYLNVYGASAAGLRAWDSASERVDSLETEVLERFLKAHPASVVAAWALGRSLTAPPDTTTAAALYGLLKGEALASVYAAGVRDQLATARAMVPGKPAPAFSLPDTSARQVSLASFKGSYVLIHFWASWYGPGRADDRAVKRILARYHDKGLRVVGVSLDTDRGAWTAAIRRERPGWTELSDLKGWDSEAARRYGVLSLPANVLVDPRGRIVGRNLMAGHLQEALKELLK
jgi:peroxiredoxin